MPVAERGDDFLHSLERDAGALLDRKRVIGWFQLDCRAQSAVPEVQVGLQMQRFAIVWEVAAEPTEQRRLAARTSASHNS
jgi:hypothetical protein